MIMIWLSFHFNLLTTNHDNKICSEKDKDQEKKIRSRKDLDPYPING